METFGINCFTGADEPVIEVFDAHCHCKPELFPYIESPSNAALSEVTSAYLATLLAHSVDRGDFFTCGTADRTIQHCTIRLRGICLNATSTLDFPLIAHIEEKWGKCCSKNSNVVVPKIYVAYGTHPWNLSEQTCTESTGSSFSDSLRNYLLSNSSACVGETGWDRATQKNKASFRSGSQCRAFQKHWDLASEFQRVLIVHCVQSTGALLDFAHGLRERQTNLAAMNSRLTSPRAVVLHSFSGSKDTVRQILRAFHTKTYSIPIYFSFSPRSIQTYERTTQLSEILSMIPFDRILIESDSDAPQNILPSLKNVLSTLSQYTRNSPSEVAQITTRNACHLYSMDPEVLPPVIFTDGAAGIQSC